MKYTQIKGSKPPQKSYTSLGCWRDSSNRAITPSIPGYNYWNNVSVDECARKTKAAGFSVFGSQYGGQCFASHNAQNTYKKYGRANNCSNGTGGGWANNVYQLKNPTKNKSMLYQGETLKQGERLISSNNSFKAVYQTDGNFVIYNSSNRPIWASNTAYNEIRRRSNRLIMQSDGNLVIYNNSTPIWASNTSRRGGLYIIMQNNGKLVMYAANNRVIWST